MRNLNSRRSPTAAAPSDRDALTPRARREVAASALLAALDEYLHVTLSVAAAEDEWVDQHASPLGRRAHLKAVRNGKLQGVKHGRRVLVRRAELNSFLENHSVHPRTAADDSSLGIDRNRVNEVAAAVLTHVGLRQRKG